MEIGNKFNSDIHLRRLENEIRALKTHDLPMGMSNQLIRFAADGNPTRVSSMLLRVFEKINPDISEDIVEDVMPLFFDEHPKEAIDLLFAMGEHSSLKVRRLFFRYVEVAGYNFLIPLAEIAPKKVSKFILEGLNIIDGPRQLFLLSIPIQRIAREDGAEAASLVDKILDNKKINPELKSVALNHSLYWLMKHDMSLTEKLLEKAKAFKSDWIDAVLKAFNDNLEAERTYGPLEPKQLQIK